MYIKTSMGTAQTCWSTCGIPAGIPPFGIYSRFQPQSGAVAEANG